MSAGELAAFVGSIISMGAVLGRFTRIMTRHCQITVAAAGNWDTKHPLDSYCLSEIQVWLEHLNHGNRKYFFNSVHHSEIISDASNYACGALVKGGHEIACHKMFTPKEAGCSSTHRKLITILYSLGAFGANLFDSRIKWYTDNQATAKIVEVGSMKLTLQTLAYKIFRTVWHIISIYIFNGISRTKHASGFYKQTS